MHPPRAHPTGVSLSEPRTWPRKSARRVIEVVPPGVGEHWSSLRSSRVGGRARRPARSRRVGAPDNQPHGGECAVRHWYCPVVFPESDGGLSASGDDAAAYRRGWRRGDVGKGANAWTEAETAELHRLRAIKGLSWEERPSGSAPAAPKQCRERPRPDPGARRRAHGPVRRARTVVGTITHRVQPRRVCTSDRRESAAELLAAERPAAAKPAEPESASKRTRGSPRPSPVPTRPRSTPRRRDGSP